MLCTSTEMILRTARLALARYEAIARPLYTESLLAASMAGYKMR